MIKLLYAGAVSACFELDNDDSYYAPGPYEVILNGKTQFTGDTNVFSLFDLRPDAEYLLTVRQNGQEETLPFRTAAERCAVSVRDFGAVGDGVTDDTSAIQSAISFTPVGARIYFPAGTYLTRPLALRSHLTLDLAPGATLLGSPDRKMYPVLPSACRSIGDGQEWMIGAFEGQVRPMYQSLIHAAYCEDVTITGLGTVDGNAQNSDFWTAFREFETARPRLMFFNQCKKVTLHGVTAKNSPSWTLHPFYSDHVSLFDVRVQAPKNSPNTDAIDPEACDDVKIIGCRLSVGDDCVAVKSGKIEMTKEHLKPASRHVIRNCLMEFGHGAVTLGSETACGVKDLTVTRCLFDSTDRGLRIKTRRGRGKDCDITGITFENIRMKNVITPFVVNMWYNCCDPDRFSDYVKSREKLPVDERTPHLGEFTFRDIACEDAHAAACYIDGLPEMPVDKVTFERVSISFARDAKPFVPAMQNDAVPRLRLGLYLSNVRQAVIRDVRIKGAQGGAVVAHNCGDVQTDGLMEE